MVNHKYIYIYMFQSKFYKKDIYKNDGNFVITSTNWDKLPIKKQTTDRCYSPNLVFFFINKKTWPPLISFFPCLINPWISTYSVKIKVETQRLSRHLKENDLQTKKLSMKLLNLIKNGYQVCFSFFFFFPILW